MAKTTQIITVSEVESNALKTATFDDALIEDFILPSQRHYLRPFLGIDFYNELLTQVELSTLTSDNSTLLNDWIKPMLSYYIVYDAFPSIRVNITSKGVMINQSETSVAASNSEASTLRQNYLSLAERWKKDTTDYIEEIQDDDSSKYPLFKPKKDQFNNKGMFVI
jgi:hypothetical protein